MVGIFPKRNDFSDASYEELVAELAKFGIDTKGAFRRLMIKHRLQLLKTERGKISPKEQRELSEWLGAEAIADKLRRQYWFAYQGLVRSAAELEFGEEASVYEEPSPLLQSDMPK
jgi:hypothetical protein